MRDRETELVEKLRNYPQEIEVTKLTSHYDSIDTEAICDAAADFIESQQTVISNLLGALTEMIYETTHLSPRNEDGSHDCRICASTLSRARLARSAATAELGE